MKRCPSPTHGCVGSIIAKLIFQLFMIKMNEVTMKELFFRPRNTHTQTHTHLDECTKNDNFPITWHIMNTCFVLWGCLDFANDFTSGSQLRWNSGSDKLHYEKVGAGILVTWPQYNGNILVSKKLIYSFMHSGQFSHQNEMLFFSVQR